MTNFLYDEDGYVGEVATNKGLTDTMDYLAGKDIPELTKFIEEGYDIVPEAIAEELEKLDPPAGEVKKTIDNLIVLLHKSKGIAIISDALNDDLLEE